MSDMVKDPADTLDYTLDFSRWLPADDVISAASATASGGTATVTSTEHDDQTVRVWITGGAAGETAEVEVTITTAGGRTKKQCFRLKVRNCH